MMKMTKMARAKSKTKTSETSTPRGGLIHPLETHGPAFSISGVLLGLIRILFILRSFAWENGD